MNELLAQLNDITLPTTIGFELAYGWYLVVFLVLLLSAALIYFSYYRRRHNNNDTNLTALAKTLLADIDNDFKQHGNAQQLAAECNLLLRKYVKQTLGITPNSDNNFLTLIKQYQPPSAEVLSILSTVVYQPKASFNSQILIDYCHHLIDAIAVKNV